MRGIIVLAVALTLNCGLAVAQQAKHDAKAFECGFIYDKFKGGKSGAAACSYEGERVFATPGEPFPANEHCKTELVYGYDDLINFRVDLTSNRVTWDSQFGLASFAEPEQIEYLMRKEKITREEATAKAKVKGQLMHNEFDIHHTEKTWDVIYIDEISRTSLKPPKYVPAYLILFGDVDSKYSIYIPARNSNAILSEYVGSDVGSWVSLRFGKCRAVP